MLLTPNIQRAGFDLDRIFTVDNRETYVLRKVERYGMISLVTMEKVDTKTWTLTGSLKEFSGDLFFCGGHGGGPYITTWFNNHIRKHDNAFYCPLDETIS